VDQEGVPGLTIPTSGETREDFTVVDQTTGKPYRFVLPGPLLSESEWRACLDAFTSLDQRVRFVVASGSLPPGIPQDFYSRIAKLAKQADKKAIIDTSGPPLKAALQAGVYLIKPSLREFKLLMGESLESQAARITACRSLIDNGQVEIVALTLGDQGALLVTHDRVLRARALPIKLVSVVGAGDSFLGAMGWSLACGHAIETAFRYGVAAGSTALLMPGTELCRREDVERPGQ
jgi:6-phosphofructokinase 2